MISKNKVKTIHMLLAADASVVLSGYGELILYEPRVEAQLHDGSWTSFHTGACQYRGWFRPEAGVEEEEIRKTYGLREPLIAYGDVRINVVIREFTVNRIDFPSVPIRLELASTGAPLDWTGHESHKNG